MTFHVVRPRDSDRPDDVYLVTADAGGVRDAATSCTADWSRRNGMGLAYPDEVAFANGLRLSSPRVLHATPFSLDLVYDSRFGDEAGRAFCEVVYPQRLTWPGVGRLVERSIRQAGTSLTPPGGAGAAR